jgi:PAS domain S-box-containing protein
MTTPDLLTGLRILIVEDESVIADALVDRLQRTGMRVVGTADSADAAVAAAIQTRPDLVLMDIQIQGLKDGVDAAHEIRQHLDVPVIYLSAHSDRTTLERAKRTAPFGYVLKPLRERELLIAIELASHRYTLERRLRDSERKYVATLASIGDGVIAIDLEQRITFMNPVAEALTGFSARDAEGLPVGEIFRVVRDVTAGPIVNTLAEAMRSRKTIRIDDQSVFLITRTNEAIPIDECASPIADDDGAVTGGVVAFRDIRERRLAEGAIRRAQEEVFQSRRMEMTGRFAAGIAHHFNNMLQVINGCTQLALSMPVDPNVRNLLSQVLAAGDRAATLTRQFLDFGQRQIMRSEVIELNAVVATISATLRRMLAEHIVIKAVRHDQPVRVFIDPSHLEQVIVNLALNARDAMPDGGTLTISIDIAESTAPDDPDGAVRHYGVLTVADTGHGMNGGVRERVFEPFFTTKEAGKGTGMGLASAYGIVNRSDGFIKVRSAPGEGAAFAVWLPLIEPAS